MSRRTVLPLALGVVLLGTGAALADANGSTEQQKVTRNCSAPADNRYTPPGPNDCKNGATTYQSTYYSNDVRCGDKNAVTPANAAGVRVYASQGGGAGLCSDGALPVQGRVNATGGTSGGALTIDGDKDNAAPNGNETARGWATVGVTPGGPTLVCGDEHSQGGRADSDAPQAGRDKQEECAG